MVDADGQAFAHVYSRDHPHAAPIANVLTEDEARRIAANIAKLPVLLGCARRDDDRLEAENCQMNVATPRTYAIAREWISARHCELIYVASPSDANNGKLST